MTVLVFAVVLALAMSGALILGEWAHRRRPVSHDELHGGFRLDVLAGASLTLAVIMCSFMLAVSYDAYDAANRDAGVEAGTIAGLYEAAGLLEDRAAAQALQQGTICYARAVAYDEWPRLGTEQPGSTLVDGWRNSLNATIRAAETSDEQSALSTVRSAQLERTAARQTRLVTAQKQAPAYLFGLLILVSAVAMLLVTAFTVRGMPALLRVPIILTLTLLLSATLLIINDLDHPFRGISNISAQFVADVAANNSTDYQNVWAIAVDACDETGHPNRTG